jgi:hypothetical protein
MVRVKVTLRHIRLSSSVVRYKLFGGTCILHVGGRIIECDNYFYA